MSINNQPSQNNQIILYEQSEHNQKLINLHKLLYDKLYLENIQSCNTKDELKYYIKPKEKLIALHDNFIRYGTNKATSFLIIDVDNVNTPIEQYQKEVEYKLQIKPNWITRTDKGYHIGIILEDTVYLNDDIKENRLREMKINFTALLNGDIAGSHKLYGYWRNPLTHKSIIQTKELYNLDELYKLSFHQLINDLSLFDTETEKSEKIRKQKLKKNDVIKMNIDKISKQGFTQGNRNNYLFHKIIALLYASAITNDEILETLQKLNNNELPHQELKRIYKSIKKYNIKPNSATEKTERHYKKGEYHQELWENGIHNYKDYKNGKTEFSRQKFGQTVSTAKIIKSTIEKLFKGYLKTYEKHERFINKNISLNSGVNKRTVQRYRNNRKVENDIKIKAFKVWIMSLVEVRGDIEKDKQTKECYGKCHPYMDIVNKLLEEVIFEYKKTNKFFNFTYTEDDRLIFYNNNTLEQQLVA